MSVLSEEIKERIRAEFPKYANKRAVTLPALHIVQDEHRCVSTEAIREVAGLLELPPAEVYDTLSFYGFFRDESAPLGKHRVWVCRSLSCALRGGEELLDEISAKLGRRAGRDNEPTARSRSNSPSAWEPAKGRPACSSTTSAT